MMEWGGSFLRVLELCCTAAGHEQVARQIDGVQQTIYKREELSVCRQRQHLESYTSPFFPALGLTYDEVISFVPPPLDQEEMES